MTGRRYLLTPLVALSLAAFSASSAQSAAPTKVGNGWDFTHYFVADWTADGTPDLVVRDSQGDLLLYPFKYNTFYNAGGPTKVGNGWNFTHYFVADWTADGT